MIRAVISDIDGTLIDSVELIRRGMYEAVRGYLEDRGVAKADVPGFATFVVHVNGAVGGTARESIEKAVRLLYVGQSHRLDGIDYDEIQTRLDRVQDELAAAYVRPYAGLEAWLETLGDQRVGLALFTSGRAHHVVRNVGLALPKLGLKALFRDDAGDDGSKLDVLRRRMEAVYGLRGLVIVTAEDIERSKPDPNGIVVACERLGVSPRDVLMLGDHAADMQAAAAADVPTRVGVTHGFDDAATLRAAGATVIVRDLAQTLKLLGDER
jgi:phosphoglycolate phosphatase-like HAD superfamily hydrolase